MRRFTQEDLINDIQTGSDGEVSEEIHSMREASESHLTGRRGEHGASGAVQSRAALLSRTLETEIIPRLVKAHRPLADKASVVELASPQIDTAELDQFFRLISATDDQPAEDFLNTLRHRAISVDAIYLDLLVPAAQRLEALWEEDRCDFMEVTLGFGRLQHLLREISPAFCQTHERTANGRRLLLLQGPGQQQPLGLMLVAEYFYRDGWDVSFGPNEDGEDPVKTVKNEWFDVVGFSRGKGSHTAALAESISKVRKSAMNRSVQILVGDPVSPANDDYARKVNADALSNDVRSVTQVAEKLISSMVK